MKKDHDTRPVDKDLCPEYDASELKGVSAAGTWIRTGPGRTSRFCARCSRGVPHG